MVGGAKGRNQQQDKARVSPKVELNGGHVALFVNTAGQHHSYFWLALKTGADKTHELQKPDRTKDAALRSNQLSPLQAQGCK